jgi:CRISPR/Cas system CMR-associated protein Cmr5 small subunit
MKEVNKKSNEMLIKMSSYCHYKNGNMENSNGLAGYAWYLQKKTNELSD